MNKDDFMDAMGQTKDDLVQEVDAKRQKKPTGRWKLWVGLVAACVALAMMTSELWLPQTPEVPPEDAVMEVPAQSHAETDTERGQETPEEQADAVVPSGTLAQLGSFPEAARLQLLDFSAEPYEAVTPSTAPYSAGAGLSNVINLDKFWFSEEEAAFLEENLFLVRNTYYSEFYELYESNRYNLVANYVTVDSLMHTYHLYFSFLLNYTEKTYLADALLELSLSMLSTSMGQYEALAGTQWEEAARRNVAYFAIAAALQEPKLSVPDYVQETVQQELAQIDAAESIALSPVAMDMMDYSQFTVRGDYAGDETLERYFRAMMWYGQVNYAQNQEDLNRSALLMTLALAQSGLDGWEKIYTVTSFFAGASDDLGYYEYAPAIEAAYGGYPDTERLVQDEAAFAAFVSEIQTLSGPNINSVPTCRAEEGELSEINRGFRFMGQRFTIDAAIMQQLVYRAVDGQNSDGSYRMLPDTLDVAAAMGSDTALDILTRQGETEYDGYSENMQELRTVTENAAEASWTSSLYSSWLYTLKPLLEEKGEGYPSYMQSTEWSKKALETFAGSYTELKHDMVLYSKQVMAEMGGGPPEEIDDRGYVEPEPEVYHRFMLLAQQTAEGLAGFGMLDAEDQENLERLAELARRLLVISNKELQDQLLTDEEYDLIREYGGTLEHFWIEAVEDRAESEWLDPQEIPASLVTDIATDPDAERVLEIGNARPAEVRVIVNVDGKPRIASGVVYNFYQFEQPLSERLTDAQWRQMTGEWCVETTDKYGKTTWSWDGNEDLEKPWWTRSYWFAQ